MKKIIMGLFFISITFSSAKDLMICDAKSANTGMSNNRSEAVCLRKKGKSQSYDYYNLFDLVKEGWTIVGIVNGEVTSGYSNQVSIYLVK